jgi:Putative restriction endonuclease
LAAIAAPAQWPWQASRLPTQPVSVHDQAVLDHLGPKRVDYAKAGLPEYWVLDVNARALHRSFDLREGNYANRDIIRAGEKLGSATLAGMTTLFDPPALP